MLNSIYFCCVQASFITPACSSIAPTFQADSGGACMCSFSMRCYWHTILIAGPYFVHSFVRFTFVAFCDFEMPGLPDLIGWTLRRYSISWIQFWICRENGCRLSGKIHSVCNSETGFRFSEMCYMTLFVRSFVLSGVAIDCWQSFDVPSAIASIYLL